MITKLSSASKEILAEYVHANCRRISDDCGRLMHYNTAPMTKDHIIDVVIGKSHESEALEFINVRHPELSDPEELSDSEEVL